MVRHSERRPHRAAAERGLPGDELPAIAALGSRLQVMRRQIYMSDYPWYINGIC
jgi:hypothetical protein